jgi:hypothetical protein
MPGGGGGVLRCRLAGQPGPSRQNDGEPQPKNFDKTHKGLLLMPDAAAFGKLDFSH